MEELVEGQRGRGTLGKDFIPFIYFSPAVPRSAIFFDPDERVVRDDALESSSDNSTSRGATTEIDLR